MEAKKDLAFNYNYWLLSKLSVDINVCVKTIELDIDSSELPVAIEKLDVLRMKYAPYFSLEISGDQTVEPSFLQLEPAPQGQENSSISEEEELNSFLQNSRNLSFNWTVYERDGRSKLVLCFHKAFFDIFKISQVVDFILYNTETSLDFDRFSATENVEQTKDYWAQITSRKATQLDALRKIGERQESSFETASVKIALNQTSLSNTSYLNAFLTLINRYTGSSSTMIGYETQTKDQAAHFFPFYFEQKAAHSFEANQHELEAALSVASQHFVPLDILLRNREIKTTEVNNHPFFQIVFTAIESESAEQIVSQERGSEFKLHAYLIKNKEETSLLINYNTAAFQAAAVEKFGKNYAHLLGQIQQDSGSNLASYQYVAPDEMNSLKAISIGNENPAYLGKCLHTVFEEIAARFGDRIAVVSNRNKITYRELNSKANQLARFLVEEKKIDSSCTVGICLERSIDAIVGMLATLKAGASYIPIDPNLPMDRIIYIMENSEIKNLITNERFGLAMPVFWSDEICVDLIQRELAQYSPENLNIHVDPQDLCYIIYTSGSTGKPKGAMLHHEGVVNRILWGIDHQLTEESVILQRTTLSFDVSVWEIYGALLSGGKLVLLDADRDNNIEYIRDQVIKHQITHIDFVPSQLKAFLNQGKLEQIKSLDRITSAGESLSVSLKNETFEKLNCHLFNLYGPTEASLAVTYWECEKHSDKETIPIGVPMDNTEVYVLDSSLNIVPFGVLGEIYIGGKCVGKGYYNNQEITEEKFVPNTVSPTRSNTLYKTGDIGRIHPDGYIEFLGRNDQQVKIRGYRIELEEVENVVEAIEEVTNAVVQVVGEDFNKKMICYLTLKKSNFNTVEEIMMIKQHLSSKLPAYMIPVDYMIVPTIFLTHNGKKDRLNLPEFRSYRTSSNEETKAVNGTEMKLLEIYREVLQLDALTRIDLEDSFYDLGGNSLLLLSLMERVEAEFDVKMDFMSIIDKLSVRKLSDYVIQLEVQLEQI